MELIPKHVKDERAEVLALNLEKIATHRQLEGIPSALLNGAEALAHISNPIIVAAQSLKAHIGRLRA